MFDKNFYPTPAGIASIMLAGVGINHHKTILDPSAGKGDLLDAICRSRGSDYSQHRYRDDKDGMYAIEIQPDLQAILRDKGYSVIDTDFLAYNGLQYFDCIIMNPPFDDGASHLLKAWDVANGAIIRCLLNSETLNNPHSEERKRLKKIISRYGWAKELGQAFKDAERKTNVNVILVHLHDTRKKESFRVDFEPEKVNGRYKVEDLEENAIVSPNVFDAYEARYNAGIEAFKELLLARQKVGFFFDPLLTEHKSGRNLVEEALKGSLGSDISYQSFMEDVTKSAWDHLFAKTKLGNVVTESVRKDLQKAQTEQGQMAFTASNMEALFSQLFLSREQIMLDCVLDSFDSITKWYKGNREHIEGWATNNAYFVGKRFIMPNMGASYYRGLSYESKQKIADIEKSLSFLVGRKFETITSVGQVYDRDSHFGEKMQSTYFETKLYKRGTLHFRWLDEDLRQQFNRVVAQERFNFLPEKIKKGFYK